MKILVAVTYSSIRAFADDVRFERDEVARFGGGGGGGGRYFGIAEAVIAAREQGRAVEEGNVDEGDEAEGDDEDACSTQAAGDLNVGHVADSRALLIHGGLAGWLGACKKESLEGKR